MRFSFVDCTTLWSRRHFCFEEVFNRRLAPDVYARVVPIMRSRNGFVLGDLGDEQSHDLSDVQRHHADEHKPESHEFAVKVRRLPEARMLDRLVAHGSAGPGEIHLIAERLARFHREAAAAQGWT